MYYYEINRPHTFKTNIYMYVNFILTTNSIPLLFFMVLLPVVLLAMCIACSHTALYHYVYGIWSRVQNKYMYTPDLCQLYILS